MKTRKGLVSFAVLSCIVFASQAVSAKDLKIGVVDFQKVLEESKVISKLNQDLEEKIKAEEGVISQRRETLQKKKDDFDKQQSMMNENVRVEKEGQLRQELKDLQRYANDKQDELQRQGSELMKTVVKELSDIVKEIALKEGYTAVLERNAGVIYAEPSLEITDRVIKEYDKRHK
jgi:outer membrane protein